MLGTLAAIIISQAQPSLVTELIPPDRARQSAAVERLALATNEHDDELIDLWRSTDRFDVQACIAEVFRRRGRSGITPLIALTRTRITDHDRGSHELLTRALADAHPDSTEALIRDIESEPGGNGYLLSNLLRRTDADLLPVFHRLAESEAAHARFTAASQLLPWLPRPERSHAALRLARDPDERTRRAVQLPPWTDAERHADPAAFAAYLDGIVALLAERGPGDLPHLALDTLIQSKASSPALFDAAQSIADDRQTPSHTRAQALRVYLNCHESKAAGTLALLHYLDADPRATCQALGFADLDALSEESVRAIVGNLARAQTSEFNTAAELIMPVRRHADAPHIGRRALPALLDALRDGDDELSRAAASVLGSFGAEAAEALPILVARLTRHDGWQSDPKNQAYCAALVAINPDHPDARPVLTHLVQDSGDGRARYVSGNTLRALVRARPELDWVRDLAAEIMADPNHPLHEYIMWFPPPETADLIEANTERIIQELVTTTARDAAWAFALGAQDEPPDPSALTQERDTRIAAARAIRTMQHAPPRVVSSLILALQSDVLEAPEPREESPSPSRQAAALQTTWNTERAICSEVARTLASLLDQHPEHFARVVEQLAPHPTALAIVVSCPIWTTGSTSRPLPFPADLSAEHLDALLRALVSHAPIYKRFDATQQAVISALGRLPTSDPKRSSTLLQLVHHGRGSEAPPAALAALGHTRPTTPELLDIIREHLDDPRYLMRSAACAAAGHAGPSAAPLIPLLIEIGHAQPGTSSSLGAIRALQQIAPDHPEIEHLLQR
ncbi:MAG: HEAT repeat domain-containing protein [Phycisphaerales bacterium JB054]